MSGRCVLIVDDDEDLRDLLATVVRMHGLEALLASDCETALALLHAEAARIDLVFLDYLMPGMRPADCCREVISMIRPGVKVVLITAAVDALARASELGITHYLAKPFDLLAFTRYLTPLVEDTPEGQRA